MRKNGKWKAVFWLIACAAACACCFGGKALAAGEGAGDPLAANQWHLEQLGAQKAWQTIEGLGKKPGEGVVVAILDTGIDTGHEDLKENLWVNEAERDGAEGVDDDGNGWVDDVYGYNFAQENADVSDVNGHGTKMAGIVAMTEGNGVGGVGIAYGAKVMAVKVSANGSFETEDVIQGVRYAVQNGADVINMSFGGAERSALLEETLQEASKSCILVAAAGNNGRATNGSPVASATEDFYPGGFSCVLGVMSVGADGRLSTFSNWDGDAAGGASYELAAPGDGILTTQRKGGYATDRGTSPACAVASGAAAILRGAYQDQEGMPVPSLQKLLVEAMRDKTAYQEGDAAMEAPLLSLTDLMEYAMEAEVVPDTLPPEGEDLTEGEHILSEAIPFRLKASDNRGVRTAKLRYRMGSAEEYAERTMEPDADGVYHVEVTPGKSGELEYFFEIWDGTFYSHVGNTGEPRRLTVYRNYINRLTYGTIAAQAYTGSPIEPGLEIRDGGKLLEPGRDYAVSYTDNVGPGMACAHVSACGEYLGGMDVYFYIEERAEEIPDGGDNEGSGGGNAGNAGNADGNGGSGNAATSRKDISKCRIDYAKRKFVWNGRAKRPVFLVYDGETCLEERVDYKVSVPAAKKVGSFRFQVVGKGQYKGRLSGTFQILPPTVKGVVVRKKQGKAVSISWKKARGGIKGYVVYASRRKNGGYRQIAIVKKNRIQMKRKWRTYRYVKVAAYGTSGGKRLAGQRSRAARL